MKRAMICAVLLAVATAVGCQKKEPDTSYNYDQDVQDYDQPMDTAVVEDVVYDEPAPAAGQTYVVQKGDTLYGISKKFYGTGTRVRDIASANNLADPNKIFVGQELVIP